MQFLNPGNRDAPSASQGKSIPGSAILRFFRGTLPPQRSDRNGNCLSAFRREFCRCSEVRRCRVEKRS